MWITYDPQGSFPQAPRIEGRLNKPRNHHTPPEGLASFEVEAAALVHGSGRGDLMAFYTVTEPGILEPKPDAEVAAIRMVRARVRALDRIDDAAGEARARFITTAPGQESVYQLKREHALAYAAAGYTGDVPAMVAAEAAAQGITEEAAADFILATAEQWIAVAAQVEQLRQAGKTAVRAAGTAAEIETIVSDTLDGLNAIRPD